jgi:hypothetical protein
MSKLHSFFGFVFAWVVFSAQASAQIAFVGADCSALKNRALPFETDFNNTIKNRVVRDRFPLIDVDETPGTQPTRKLVWARGIFPIRNGEALFEYADGVVPDVELKSGARGRLRFDLKRDGRTQSGTIDYDVDSAPPVAIGTCQFEAWRISIRTELGTFKATRHQLFLPEINYIVGYVVAETAPQSFDGYPSRLVKVTMP